MAKMLLRVRSVLLLLEIMLRQIRRNMGKRISTTTYIGAGHGAANVGTAISCANGGPTFLLLLIPLVFCLLSL